MTDLSGMSHLSKESATSISDRFGNLIAGGIIHVFLFALLINLKNI